MPVYKVRLEGKEYSVTVNESAGGTATVSVEGQTFEVEPLRAQARTPAPATAGPAPAAPKAAAVAAPTPAGSGTIAAPIPGVVTKLCVAVGDSVTAGQVVLQLEAMKMENALPAPASGVINSIHFKSGDSVAKGDVLCVIG